jgi:hypothetical protein
VKCGGLIGVGVLLFNKGKGRDGRLGSRAGDGLVFFTDPEPLSFGDASPKWGDQSVDGIRRLLRP